jgi:hypothetical protein
MNKSQCHFSAQLQEYATLTLHYTIYLFFFNKTGNVSISKHLSHIRVTIVVMETQKEFVFYC